MRTLAALALVASLAPLHVPPRMRLAEPAEGARVAGATVRVVVVGDGGSATGMFGLTLDGQPVGADGKVGGLFTSLSVAPDAQTTLRVPVPPGPHTLVLTPDRDTDSSAPVVTRRFEVLAADGGGGAGPALAFAGAAVVVAIGAAVLVRRRAMV